MFTFEFLHFTWGKDTFPTQSKQSTGFLLRTKASDLEVLILILVMIPCHPPALSPLQRVAEWDSGGHRSTPSTALWPPQLKSTRSHPCCTQLGWFPVSPSWGARRLSKSALAPPESPSPWHCQTPPTPAALPLPQLRLLPFEPIGIPKLPQESPGTMSLKDSFFSWTASLTTSVHHGVRGLLPLEALETLWPPDTASASTKEAVNIVHSGTNLTLSSLPYLWRHSQSFSLTWLWLFF